MCAGQDAGPPRSVLSLNGTWSRIVTRSSAKPPADGIWSRVQVPALGRSNAAGGSRFAWYRRRVTIPAEWKGKRIFLRLWGARFAPRVFVDGKLVGSRLEGWTPFEVEITDAARPGTTIRLNVCCQDWGATFKRGFRLPENVSGDLRRNPLLRAKITAPIGGHWSYYGIWDDVELHARSRIFLDDIAVVPSVRRGELSVTGRIHGAARDMRVSGVVLDGDRVVLRLPPRTADGSGQWRVSAPFPNAHYWSPEDPHLYRLVLRLHAGADGSTVDETHIRFGFRELWAKGQDFYFNGVKRHLPASSTWPAPRYQSLDEIRTAIRDIKAAHCIAFRLHTQPWQHHWLDIADEEGLMLVEEGALWCDGAGGYDYRSPELWKNIREHLAGMVRRDRNHASLVMWSIENEILHCGAARYAPDVEANLAAVGRFVKALDPAHLITFEADLDPGGVADVIGLHYPHEMPEYTDYPNTADWLDQTVTTGTGGGLLGSRHKNFRWKRNKPLYIGEYLWVPSGRFAPGTVFFGEAAYIDRARMNRAAKALAWKYQTQAYRRADVSGMCPWTFAGQGGRCRRDDVLYLAQKEAFVPLAAFPADADTRFFGGERIIRRFDLFNDTPETHRLELHGVLGEQKASAGPFTLEPGTHATAILQFTLPQVRSRRELPYRVELLADGKPVHRPALSAVAVYPKRPIRLPAGVRVVLYDPKNAWHPGVRADRITNPAALARLNVSTDILVVAPDAFEPRALPNDGLPAVGVPKPGARELRDFLARGGRMLVLEQHTLTDLPLDIQLVDHPSTMVFPLPAAPELLRGLTPADFKFWRGDNYVSRREIRRPARYGARTILVSGGARELDQGPLVEVRAGTGRVLLCQALVGAKIDREPAARILFENCLAYLARQAVPEDEPPTPVLSSDDQFVEVLQRLGVRLRRISPGTEAVFPKNASLLILHGGGDWQSVVRAFLRPESTNGRRTIYWHAPSAAEFARLKEFLGAGALSILPGAGPVTRETDDAPIFRGVSREELYFVGSSSGRDWRKPVSPDPNIIDSWIGPAENTTGDCIRIPAASMQIEGHIVHSDSASGKVLFATNGVATTRIRINKAGLHRLTIRAGGTPLDRVYPLIRVSVNGRAAAEVMLTEGEERPYPVLVPLPAGTVELAVAFVNDASADGEDRNLVLGSVTVDTAPFALPGAQFLTRPPAVVVLDIPAAPNRAPYRLVLDTIRWDRPGRNRVRANRYASAVLANLGAAFARPQTEADWILPNAIEPIGEIPYFKKTATEVSIVAAGSVQAEFLCKRAGRYTVVLRARSRPAGGTYAVARISIDGRQVGECEVRSEVSDVFTAGTAALSPGRHRVVVEYTNDVYDPDKGWDRNFYLNAVGFAPAE